MYKETQARVSTDTISSTQSNPLLVKVDEIEVTNNNSTELNSPARKRRKGSSGVITDYLKKCACYRTRRHPS